MGEWDFTIEDLRAAVARASNSSQVLNHLGIPSTSNSRKRIRRRIKKLGLDIGHFKYRRIYTDEDLRRAVREEATLDQVVTALGLTLSRGSQQRILRRIRDLGIDAKHLSTRSRLRVDDGELRRLVPKCRSYAELLRCLGIKQFGSSQARIKARVSALGLDTSHFSGQAVWRGKKMPFRPRMALEDLLIEGRPCSTNSLRRRLLAEGVKQRICESCRLTEWRGQPIPLELHHVNGRRTDNRLENLIILCPNCHAMTPTFRGKNKGRRSV